MTQYLDRNRLTLIAAVLTFGTFAGCSVEPPGDVGSDRVVEQLELSRQALSAKGLPLRIVGYAVATPLDTEDAVRDAKAQLLDSGAIVPAYDGVSTSSFALATIAERTRAFHAGDDGQDVVANIQDMVFPLIDVGQQTMDVTWESAGAQFQTTLVYDENGIVYDNLLSNLAFVEVQESTGEVARMRPGSAEAATTGGVLGSDTVAANQSWSTRFLDYHISWVWGGTRGKIELDHYVISCDGWVSFCDDGGAANAWMSVGSAGGQTRRNALKKPRISKLAWGYGWATPTASFSITWSSGSLSFSASTGGVGSAGKGAGIHSII